MPRKKEKEVSCCGMGPGMAQNMDKFKGKMWMHGPMMMFGGGCNCGCGCHHKGHGLGAFVFAVSIVWILGAMGMIPYSVPWWLQALAVLGFTAMFS